MLVEMCHIVHMKFWLDCVTLCAKNVGWIVSHCAHEMLVGLCHVVHSEFWLDCV